MSMLAFIYQSLEAQILLDSDFFSEKAHARISKQGALRLAKAWIYHSITLPVEKEFPCNKMCFYTLSTMRCFNINVSTRPKNP